MNATFILDNFLNFFKSKNFHIFLKHKIIWTDGIGTSDFGVVMFFKYYLKDQEDWVYTVKKLDPMGQQTCSAHSGLLTPDHKYS